VVIDDTNPNFIFGPLYVGKDETHLQVSYDTLNAWTTLSTQAIDLQYYSAKQNGWLTSQAKPVT
jgi:hypothetical protein